MDSVTQIALGAVIMGACVPKQYGRQALMIGALLGTLPDLDVILNYGDAISNFTEHRGFTHSLFILTPLAFAIWGLLRLFYEPVRSNPKPWMIGIVLTLVTHPLLDAHNAYGTQLLWPISIPPAMFSTLFIIDPVYTLPLVVGALLFLFKPSQNWAKYTLIGCLSFSTAYIVWSWSAKMYVESQANEVLSQTSTDYRLFSTPTPFNTLLWRVVALEGNEYKEGYFSFLNPSQKIVFKTYVKNDVPDNVLEFNSIKRMEWFTHGFNRKELIGKYVLMSDLRMGYEKNYVFNFAVGIKKKDTVYPLKSVKLKSKFDQDDLGFFWDMMISPKTNTESNTN